MRPWLLAAALVLTACATARAPVGGAPIQAGERRAEPAGARPSGTSRPSAPRAQAEPPGAAPARPGPPAPAPGSGEPAYAAPGWIKPREVREGCVERAVAAPPGLWGTSDPLTLKFAVWPDGRVDSFQCITSIEDGQAPRGTARRFVRQLEAAVRGCDFEPGRDPAGRPAAMWRFLSVRALRPAAPTAR